MVKIEGSANSRTKKPKRPRKTASVACCQAGRGAKIHRPVSAMSLLPPFLEFGLREVGRSCGFLGHSKKTFSLFEFCTTMINACVKNCIGRIAVFRTDILPPAHKVH